MITSTKRYCQLLLHVGLEQCLSVYKECWYIEIDRVECCHIEYRNLRLMHTTSWVFPKGRPLLPPVQSGLGWKSGLGAGG